jgi:hypothetical protein
MKRRINFAAIFILILTSCNLPLKTSPPLAPQTTGSPPSSNSTPTVIPIETFLTYELPTRTPTATATLVTVFPKDQLVNCRFGPGLAYAVIGELRPGRQAEVIGKSPDLLWWQVRNPSDPSTTCWLSVDFTIAQGNTDALPVANPPQGEVSAILVSIEPPVLNVACDSFPHYVAINVEITATGPATVVWVWREVSTGDASAEQFIQFEEGGAKSAQEFYEVRSARDYTMSVQTLSPNSVTAQATFKAVCTP